MNPWRCCGLIVLSHVLTSPDAHACAGCRNPSLAQARGSEGPLPAGAARLGASLTGTSVHVIHEAGCRDLNDCDEVPVQPRYLHDQRLYPVELRASGEYAIDETFGVELQVPVRLVRTSIKYTTPDGADYAPLDPDVHHRDETVAGPGDPWLLMRAGGTYEGWWFAARPGVSLPLGRTEEDPFELGDAGVRHQHIQLGTGTFDPILVTESAGPLGPLQALVFVQGTLSLYQNKHGYRGPWRVQGGAALGDDIVEDLTLRLAGEVLHEAAERWDGEVKQDGNLGRTEILVGLETSYRLGDTAISLAVKVPVYRQITQGDEPPGTLTSPATLSLAVSHQLGG